MEGRDGIFDDYMGEQYREGQRAFECGQSKLSNPYERGSQMAGAWADGWEYAFAHKGEW